MFTEHVIGIFKTILPM